MASGSAQLYKLFASQFAERDGLIIYEWISFRTVRIKRDRAYIVKGAERDRFIADFNAAAPLVEKKMMRDFVLAIISLVTSGTILGPLFGGYLEFLELGLFFAHLITVFVIENRRLEELWNAPLQALALRVPAPDHFLRPRPWIKPLSDYDWKELGMGLVLGGIGVVNLFALISQPKKPEVASSTYAIALGVFALFVLIGIATVMAIAARILKPEGDRH